MSNRIALTNDQKARLFDRLIAEGIIQWRITTRIIEGKPVTTAFIERGDTDDMLVADEDASAAQG